MTANYFKNLSDVLLATLAKAFLKSSGVPSRISPFQFRNTRRSSFVKFPKEIPSKTSPRDFLKSPLAVPPKFPLEIYPEDSLENLQRILLFIGKVNSRISQRVPLQVSAGVNSRFSSALFQDSSLGVPSEFYSGVPFGSNFFLCPEGYSETLARVDQKITRAQTRAFFSWGFSMHSFQNSFRRSYGNFSRSLFGSSLKSSSWKTSAVF